MFLQPNLSLMLLQSKLMKISLRALDASREQLSFSHKHGTLPDLLMRLSIFLLSRSRLPTEFVRFSWVTVNIHYLHTYSPVIKQTGPPAALRTRSRKLSADFILDQQSNAFDILYVLDCMRISFALDEKLIHSRDRQSAVLLQTQDACFVQRKWNQITKISQIRSLIE